MCIRDSLCPGGFFGAQDGMGRCHVRNQSGRAEGVDEKAGRPGKSHGPLQCGTARRPVSSDAGKNYSFFSAGSSLAVSYTHLPSSTVPAIILPGCIRTEATAWRCPVRGIWKGCITAWTRATTPSGGFAWRIRIW